MSGFNKLAASRAGAIGLMQVMPFTAARVGLTARDFSAPAKNILAGTRLLAVLLRYYDGDLISALVAYNARPRKLFAPLPSNGETPTYVAAALRYFWNYSSRSQRIAHAAKSYWRYAPSRTDEWTAIQLQNWP